ncbi:MAG: hypothetical protein LUH09_09545, partial [Clostridiales bacterium]|nr:hypothetical protein [Clostridiales bacterium]
QSSKIVLSVAKRIFDTLTPVKGESSFTGVFVVRCTERLILNGIGLRMRTAYDSGIRTGGGDG